MSKIFIQKLEDDLNITCDLNTISNLHHLLNEEYKTYDQNHGLSKLTKVFAEMPEKFYKKCQQILKNIILAEATPWLVQLLKQGQQK